nr:hypothetical protein [Tanacetum cinerariifolium]
LPEKWLTFSQELRNANHTQTLNLTDIYGRFVYENNLIKRRYSDTKKALITTPLSFSISTSFFSNNVIQDFQKNSDDEVDERSSEEYLRDLGVENQERALLANSKHFITRRKKLSRQKANKHTKCYKGGNKGHFARNCFSKMSNPSYQSPMNNFSLVSNGFQPNFTPKRIQSSPNSNSQTNPKFQKDYKAEYKKMKAKLALLGASPLSSKNPKTFQPKNKGLVVEIYDWDDEEVFDKEEVTHIKVLMALFDAELTVRKSHARNGKWVDITIRKILKAKANLFLPCTHYGFNDQRLDDCRNYTECKICRSYDHSTLGYNCVIHIRGGVLVESFQSNELSIRVKCNTYGSIIYSTFDHNKFDHFKRAHRRNDVYVLDMSSLTPNRACFFAKALESINWLWHKMLSHLNFKNIDKLAKQNKVLGLSSLVYSKDKLCTTCEKGKHHRASFKTKQNFYIKKCLHHLHMDLFGPDHLGKFDAKADDGYFIRHSSASKAFRVYNTTRQQIEETYQVTFDESMEAIREIMRDPEREVGYGITDSWEEIMETLQGAPVSTDMELGEHMREFETRVRQDTDEIYMRLDDEQTE